MTGEAHWVVGWKPVPGASHYAISTDGEVVRTTYGDNPFGRTKRARLGVPLKQCIATSGYPCVGLDCDDGTRRVFNIHALIGAAFLRRGEGLQYVAHNDGVKTNYRLSNLEWKTPKGNAADKYIHGTHLSGDRCPWTKIADSQLPMIREWRGSGRVLAKRLGVSQQTINRIRAGTERAT